MSVRKNDRRQSDIEYENNLSKLKSYLTSKLNHCPKRYRHLIARPFSDSMTSVYEGVMGMTNLYNIGQSASIDRYRACAYSLNAFQEIIKLSYTYINISCIQDGKIKFVTDRQRKFWYESINHEVDLIYGIMKKCRKDKNIIKVVPKMRCITSYEIRNTEFLDRLSRLQIALYRAAARTSKTFQDPSLNLLLKLSRDAFYHAVEANHNRNIDNEECFNKRRNHLNKAIDSVFNMNRPVYELWPTGIFNDKEIAEISSLSDEAIKLLKSIRESDLKARRTCE